MQLKHGRTYETACGWRGTAQEGDGCFVLRGEIIDLLTNYGLGEYGACIVWFYSPDGKFHGEEHSPDFPMHIVRDVTELSARDSLIESLRGIAESWHEPLAKAHMIALLEIIDEMKKELQTA